MVDQGLIDSLNKMLAGEWVQGKENQTLLN